jgi:hypothetical protein
MSMAEETEPVGRRVMNPSVSKKSNKYTDPDAEKEFVMPANLPDKSGNL